MTTAALTRLVRAAGREPLERDTFYNIVNTPSASEPASFWPDRTSPDVLSDPSLPVV